MTGHAAGSDDRGCAAFGFADIHRDALPFLPASSGLVLDVDAGSGRDAGWFAQRGWDVVAVRAAPARAAVQHPSPAIRWIEDRLPGLNAVHRLGLGFDLIWLSGVWMQMAPADRPRAMRSLATLLKPGGRIVLSLLHGPEPEGPPVWPIDSFELERLGLAVGLTLRASTEHACDLQGRAGTRWQTVILDLPDDGGGALPLLRGVILRQEKSATYKLALLRCIARIADASPNVGREAGSHVALPLGLVALNWIRMFKPLIRAGLPQRPGARMGFVTDAFLALASVPAADLRLGGTFEGGLAEALRRALAHAARLIADMPARHLTFADDTPVFPTEYGRIPAPMPRLSIDQAMLWTYGTTHVPLDVWHALLRMSAWIEPMLIAEWVRLTQSYAPRDAPIAADTVLQALRWTEPERDTSFARQLALQRLLRTGSVACVWSGRPLSAAVLDIDHCLPWSAWACGDLWNLLPAAPEVNRRGKRERIVGAAALAEARPRILGWWQAAYLDTAPSVRDRFVEEARTTLPIDASGPMDLDALFQALDFRRLRLRQDTQIPEWAGVHSAYVAGLNRRLPPGGRMISP